ncbi:hypothetical protein CBE37_01080 [bacterium TMED277]|nr:MAG: hypothetical protein CBE37_01080 [bacterium TMED277]
MILVLTFIRNLLLSLTVFIFILIDPIGADTQSKYFKKALSDYQIKFPQDHGEHKNFKVEWWYITANLSSETFGKLGVQWTLFKNELASPNKDTPWDLSSFWMAHSAITTKKHHFYEERFARKNMGLAGVTLSPFKAWIDNWSASGDNKLTKLTIKSNGKNFSYKLELETQFSPVLQGKNGFSVKSSTGNASHYYSQPFYSVKGWVEIKGIKEKVKGLAWLDREWSSDLLSENQVGWDWLSIHLESGNKLMLFQVREKDGNNFVSGSWINKDGSKQVLSAKKISIKELKSKSYIWGKIPVKWQVDIPEKSLYLTITPLNENSFMDTLVPYWEGPVKLLGKDKGVGYLEMTGYKKYGN